MNSTQMILAELSRAWDHGNMTDTNTGAGWWILMALGFAIFVAGVIVLAAWIERGRSGGSLTDDAREMFSIVVISSQLSV